MALNPLSILRENTRTSEANDNNFTKKMAYFFELKVPSNGNVSSLGNQSFIFPLVLNPGSYSISEPFTVEKTPTQGGGLYVEENGIVLRTIRPKGHTGFKPRPLKANGPQALSVVRPDKRSFGRNLPSFALQPISGQRHFQYLQDAVFRIYGDLKKDPATSKETELLFHNPKDKEVWRVVPEKFDGNRSADKRVLYEYDIEMTAVEPGNTSSSGLSEDKSWLDSVKDGIAEAKASVDGMKGFVRDATATADEARRVVKNVDKVIDGVTQLTTATEDFVNGTTDLIEAPADLVNSVAENVEGISSSLSNVVSQTKNIPSPYLNSWNKLEQSVYRLGQFPSFFETDAQRTLRQFRERQQISDQMVTRAQAATAPTTIAGFGNLGTSPLPGTADHALAIRTAGRNVNSYTASRSHTIAEGDTLAGLAAAFLGDARLWQEIAQLNGLKPPYLDAVGGQSLGSPDHPIPGVEGIGATLRIPDFSRGPDALPILPVLGASQSEPFEVQLLGRDFELLTDDEGLFDWVVDDEHGSDDFKTVEGIDNLSQGLTLRVSIERGFHPMYQFLGYVRMVGLNNSAVDQETAEFRIIEALTNDPRIASVLRIRFEPADDNLQVEADLEVRGFSQGVNVRAIGVT